MEGRLTQSQIDRIATEDRLFPDPLLRENIPLERVLPRNVKNQIGDNFELPTAGALLEELYAEEATKALKETVQTWFNNSDDISKNYQRLSQTLAGWGALRNHPNFDGVYDSLEQRGLLPDILLLYSKGQARHDFSREYLDRAVNRPYNLPADGPYKGSPNPVAELACRYAQRNFEAINRSGDSFVTRIGLNPFRDRDVIEPSDIEAHWQAARERRQKGH